MGGAKLGMRGRKLFAGIKSGAREKFFNAADIFTSIIEIARDKPNECKRASCDDSWTSSKCTFPPLSSTFYSFPSSAALEKC